MLLFLPYKNYNKLKNHKKKIKTCHKEPNFVYFAPMKDAFRARSQRRTGRAF
jgi:hypothetical protein